jgi:hypothetical protein
MRRLGDTAKAKQRDPKTESLIDNHIDAAPDIPFALIAVRAFLTMPMSLPYYLSF